MRHGNENSQNEPGMSAGINEIEIEVGKASEGGSWSACMCLIINKLTACEGQNSPNEAGYVV